jgi:hypothetical protein
MILMVMLVSLVACKTVKNKKRADTFGSCDKCLAWVEISKDCGVLLKVILADGSWKRIAPQKFDPKFHKEGLRMKVSYAGLTQNTEKKCAEYPVVELTEAYAVR